MTWTDTAFIDRMKNDFELTFRLTTYNGRPAIFPYMWVPPLAKDPTAPAWIYIITESDAAYVPQDFKGTPYAEGTRDIRIYGTKLEGAAVVNTVAARVATLFRRDKLTAGEVMFPNVPINLIDCMSRGPMPAPVEGTFIGRLVRVMFKVEELFQ